MLLVVVGFTIVRLAVRVEVILTCMPDFAVLLPVVEKDGVGEVSLWRLEMSVSPPPLDCAQRRLRYA